MFAQRLLSTPIAADLMRDNRPLVDNDQQDGVMGMAQQLNKGQLWLSRQTGRLMIEGLVVRVPALTAYMWKCLCVRWRMRGHCISLQAPLRQRHMQYKCTPFTILLNMIQPRISLFIFLMETTCTNAMQRNKNTSVINLAHKPSSNLRCIITHWRGILLKQNEFHLTARR